LQDFVNQNGLEKDEFVFLLDKLGPVVKDLNYRVSFVLYTLNENAGEVARLEKWGKGDPRQSVPGLPEMVLPREPRLQCCWCMIPCWKHTKCQKV
jgi:hypothetical protein